MNDSRTAFGCRSIQISWRSVGVGAAEDLLGERSGGPRAAAVSIQRCSGSVAAQAAVLATGRGGGQDRAFGGGRHGPPGY